MKHYLNLTLATSEEPIRVHVLAIQTITAAKIDGKVVGSIVQGSAGLLLLRETPREIESEIDRITEDS